MTAPGQTKKKKLPAEAGEAVTIPPKRTSSQAEPRLEAPDQAFEANKTGLAQGSPQGEAPPVVRTYSAREETKLYPFRICDILEPSVSFARGEWSGGDVMPMNHQHHHHGWGFVEKAK